MTTHNEIFTAFSKIMTLATKIDANQQKVNFMHYMHGRADDAHHWQGFVENQRIRITEMRKAFEAMTAHLTQTEINAIKMEVFEESIKGQ